MEEEVISLAVTYLVYDAHRQNERCVLFDLCQLMVFGVTELILIDEVVWVCSPKAKAR